MYMHTCTLKQAARHARPPASSFNYYNAISWRQGWPVLRCCCTDAESVSCAVTDTRPQTGIVVEKVVERNPAGSRKGAVSGVVWKTSCSGTQPSPL